jgi:RNA polymerase sigma factor (sigma-70 family)
MRVYWRGTQGGDVETTELEAFCVDAYPRLVAALAHHTGDPWLAEEVAQEALIRACARWDHGVSALQSPVGWTFRVGVNLARSHFRRRLAERRALARHGMEREEMAGSRSAEAVVVWSALRQLPSRQREAVVMRYFLDLSAAQVGEAMGMSPGAVRVLAHRAVASLRIALDIEVEEEGAVDAT